MYRPFLLLPSFLPIDSKIGKATAFGISTRIANLYRKTLMKYIHYIFLIFLVSAYAILSAEPTSTANPEKFDAASQYRIGKAYIMFGHKYERALPWLEAAATQGHVDAQFTVGSLHYQGLGTQKNEAEGFKWFLAAANSGHAEAQYHIGCIYEKAYIAASARDGRHTNHDFLQNFCADIADAGEALSWYIKAAKQGLPPAQCRLGLLYLDGKIIPQDLQLAIQWLEAAAKQNYVPAQFELGIAYLFGERGILLDPQKGIHWLETTANNNEPESGAAAGYAAYILGTLYLNGEHVTQSDAEGTKWFTIATQKGSLYACYHLAFLYMTGRGAEKNIPQAIDLFTYVAQTATEEEKNIAGHAAYCLGRLYLDGTEMPQDTEQAYQWYVFAADKGNTDAQQELNQFYDAVKGKPLGSGILEQPASEQVITESTSHDTNLAESPEIS